MSRGEGVMVALLAAALLASALAVVYVKFETRKRFVELQTLCALRDELDVEWGRLQLEQSTWGAHGRVDKVARQRLQMQIPSASSVLISP